MLKSLIRLFSAFGRKVDNDNVNALSAHAAFFIILSFFPFMMFLLTLLNYIPFLSEGIPEFSLTFFPDVVTSIITQILGELEESASGTLLSVTVIVALWSASRGILAIMRGLNNIYNIRETRNYFLLRFFSTIYTLVFAVLLLILLVIFVFGNQLTLWFQNFFPEIANYALLVISIRTTIGISVLIFFFLLIYITIPNHKTSLLQELPGALLTAFGWVGFSYLFSFYINNMSNYARTYGSLTAIVLCMLWLYSCMYILFLGAEINATFANPVIRRSLKKIFHLSGHKQQKKHRSET